MAVFNDFGRVEFEKGQSAPETLLHGWKRKFDKLSNVIEKAKLDKNSIPIKYRFLSFNSEIKNSEGSWVDNKWHFPYVRIGRIKEKHADAILGSFATYHTRAAFDHDFSQGIQFASSSEDSDLEETPDADKHSSA